MHSEPWEGENTGLDSAQEPLHLPEVTQK